MDTIILKIYGPNKFRADRRYLFMPELTARRYEDLSLTEKTSDRQYLRHFVLHAPKSEDYLPGAEIFETLSKDKRSLVYILQVDFSAPKLLYGNSVQEVVEADKELLFSRLKSALARVGVMLEIEQIAEARVSAVHFCKNILLPPVMKIRGILKE